MLLGRTYGGGSAIVAAGALASVHVIREERLVENDAAMGEQLQVGLRRLQEEYSVIGPFYVFGCLLPLG